MKTIVPLTTDLRSYFDHLWQVAGNHDERDSDAELDGSRVRLDCSGEALDAKALGAVLVRHAAAGTCAEFVCPRCNALHESPLL